MKSKCSCTLAKRGKMSRNIFVQAKTVSFLFQDLFFLKRNHSCLPSYSSQTGFQTAFPVGRLEPGSWGGAARGPPAPQHRAPAVPKTGQERCDICPEFGGTNPPRNPSPIPGMDAGAPRGPVPHLRVPPGCVAPLQPRCCPWGWGLCVPEGAGSSTRAGPIPVTPPRGSLLALCKAPAIALALAPPNGPRAKHPEQGLCQLPSPQKPKPVPKGCGIQMENCPPPSLSPNLRPL